LSEEKAGTRSERVYLVDLIPTTKRFASPEEFARILPKHLAWVSEQQAAGVIWATGPVVDEDSGENTGHGVFILRAASQKDAAEIIAQDPQVTAGFKRFDSRPWLMRIAL
jgi:uncharacterized protein YciI